MATEANMTCIPMNSRDRLFDAVKGLGEDVVRRDLSLSRAMLLSCLSGEPVLRATRTAVEEYLDELDVADEEDDEDEDGEEDEDDAQDDDEDDANDDDD